LNFLAVLAAAKTQQRIVDVADWVLHHREAVDASAEVAGLAAVSPLRQVQRKLELDVG
jgi:hypothetical protein